MIVKQMIKFVFLNTKSIFMKTVKYHHFLLTILFLFINTTNIKSQDLCEWIYSDLDPDSYIIDENGTPVLFFCSDDTPTIHAPTPTELSDGTTLYDYETTYWWYENVTDTLICEDWDNDPAYGSVFQPFATNSACITDSGYQNLVINFVGINKDDSEENCSFKILVFEPANPKIIISDNNKTYDAGETPIVCEDAMIEDMLTLTATGLGTNPSTFEYTEYQWYLNDVLLEGENNLTLEVSNTNYTINDPEQNIFHFTISNFCSDTISEDRTIRIYEGYGEQCDPCQWYFPDHETNQFYVFTPNEDGIADYFPEAPNNETNRINGIQDKLSQPTCEATIYRVVIFNRLGREIFTSEYDNHPWDGKLRNGKQCKDGTYFYKIEYILNPHLSDYEQNQTQMSTGTVYLDSGN